MENQSFIEETILHFSENALVDSSCKQNYKRFTAEYAEYAEIAEKVTLQFSALSAPSAATSSIFEIKSLG